MNNKKNTLTKLKLLLCFIGIVTFLPACGHSYNIEKMLPGGVDVLMNTAPYPINAMRSEQIKLYFTVNKSPIKITNLSVNMKMVGMDMGDELKMSSTKPGEYQSSYQFSMSGKWIENVRFEYKGHSENIDISLNVN